ncbi:histidinol-phosphate transaminase [Defluviitalea raffinosedens]|jgi:histidinol-phosphate aminotransferase|uniref:Histidinol-phosphate aminotransferase n=1 Tax=Defluviitalea raffinosedens TaxID=1450156 RepID=A0A7C8HG25_9FIRM|nr:histidinol-phosphate transaminase [Defluviitalea raffinosedens]KAE9636935.1 histidinol-phosphate transaminase [Defluviitalea raffinosedens]MBM7685314.1 histidinol-phosphate aminotransferase [Defluviitalea raffinosedens]MBZ4668183.1 hisC2 [Defluviitaleaceae bacterium]HHW67247.1 histidinol-phosphate transaminase [Candidatus Epulonipiscium sp.]
MLKDYIRKELREFKPYHAAFRPQKIKLDANESPFSLSENVKSKLIQWIEKEENLNLYPDTDSTELREALASFWKVNVENVICGVGSDQLIDCMMKVFLEPGDRVVIPDPSFSMYRSTTILNHGVPIEVKLNEDYTYPVSEIIKTCNKYNSKILILCTPNNPTGNLLPTRQIEEIAQNVKCPILIDEAYGEFSNETMIPLIEKYPHMVVFRTFSKAYGLAGLRVGYGIGDREIIDAIYLTKPPYNLNVLSQKIATWVLQDEKVNRERIDYLKTEREYLIKELRKIPNIKVFDSDANFILIETQNSELANQLEKKEIFVRSFGVCEGTLLLRITVGTKEQNEKLLKVLKSIII